MNRTMKRTLSLFLAMVMAAALLVCPAAAASAPWVQVDGRGTDSQSVTLQGLPDRYTSVQLTLNLDSAPSGLSFAPAVSDGQSYTTYRQDGNSLTVYLTSKTLLNQGSSLPLGTLTANGSFRVSSVSGLKLVNVGPNDTQTVIYNEVSMDGGSGSGSSSGSGTASSRYPVSLARGITGGSVQLSAAHARKGDTVTVTALPDPGCRPDAITVTGSNDRKVSAAKLGEGKWSFVMPASAVTVNVSFVPEQIALPFHDVAQDDWFWESVDYVYRTGLMSGTDANSFSPSTATTRGMVVAILHRYEGSPSAAPSAFKDVSPNQYYAGAVSWASANGVVSGYRDGIFDPDQTITREQMASILYRYAQYKGLDVSGRADLSSYSDVDQVSGYAADAMSWANHTGLISGMDDHTLQPTGSATRAQVAAILMRFCKHIESQESL